MNFTFLNDAEKIFLEKQYKSVALIGFSIISSIPFYLIAGHLVNFERQHTGGITIRYIFLSIALIIAVFIRILRSIILSKQNKPVFLNLVNRLKASAILTFALCEAIAITGITEYFLTGNKMDLYIMLFLSLVFFAVHFPRKSLWEYYINLHIRELQK
ncbi:MAG: hypothetical protein N3B13_11015 [Deltaproteobacteria bacterium]|nr:hypothetical protein [Deltaproteobacteria bacterium]